MYSALEVKACHSLQRKNGQWYYGHDPHGDPRGPFKQASEADPHSLRQQVIRTEPALSLFPSGPAVAFPYVEFKAISDEWHPWQVMNTQPSARWFHEADRLPTQQQAAAIARILRPSFEFSEKPPDRRARQQADLLRYTEEQFVALDTMADNQRALFDPQRGSGPAMAAADHSHVESRIRDLNMRSEHMFKVMRGRMCVNVLVGGL